MFCVERDVLYSNHVKLHVDRVLYVDHDVLCVDRGVLYTDHGALSPLTMVHYRLTGSGVLCVESKVFGQLCAIR